MSLIEMWPGVRSDKPYFADTRITVYDVPEYLAQGLTTKDIIADFPKLTPDHVKTAIEFVARRERRLATA